MKKFITTLFIFLVFAAISCDYLSREYVITYEIDSEKPVTLQVIYKAGEKYITETVKTPFAHAVTFDFDKLDDNTFYYFLQASFLNPSEGNDIKIHGRVYLDDKLLDSFSNDPKNPEPAYLVSGYVKKIIN